jgi:pimeloyl-ACP methyl ester carboxylesterase
MSLDARSAIKAGDALIRVEDLKWAQPKDFMARDLVIIVHGFTAHGGYLQEIGRFIEQFGYQVFIFNYNSFRGLRRASESLADFLSRYDKLSDGAISRNRIFVVGHSMGGLVARHLALIPEAAKLMRGIVMLGTPNDGCFPSARWLSFCIQYGEYLSQLMPEAANPACLSSKELIKADKASTPIIDALNEVWSRSDLPPSISISGGKRYLVVSGNPLKNWIANRQIQAEMADNANDGLVTESSVDMSGWFETGGQRDYIHFNRYPYYQDLNHTHLKENQTLALEIIDWFKKH